MGNSFIKNHLPLKIILLFSFLTVAFLFYARYYFLPTSKGIDSENVITITNFEDYYLKGTLGKKSVLNTQEEKKLRLAIIPHHLLPSFIHADFFNIVGNSKPANIILIGPNHENLGDHLALTTQSSWKSNYGLSTSNKDLIKNLNINLPWVGQEGSILKSEHSVTSLIPFFHYYTPKSNITAIILKQGISSEQISSLYNYIIPLVDANTLVVFSIDFSHYLNSYQAVEHDAETLSALKSKDINLVLGMGNDNVDSPESLALFLNFVKGNFDDSCRVLQNTNSGEILNDPYKSTTSYFYIVCF